MIQLDRVHTQRGWAPFYAKLVKLDAASQAQIQPQNPEQVRLALLQSDPNAEFPEPEVPGVATVIFQRSKGELPAGTKMVWKLELLQINSKDTPIPQLSTPKGLR